MAWPDGQVRGKLEGHGWQGSTGAVAVVLELRLLGDVQVRIAGQVLDIGHARQRCVLAVLLVEANRLVSVDQLIDRVWADRPPQRARGALYNYVSRLRHALAASDDVGVTRQTGGYVLVVDPMAVDLHRFRRLAAKARAAAGDGEAAAWFAQALGLWRGEALATVDTPWLNTVRDGLEQERLAAELDSNDVELRCGRHAGLLGELFARAAAHPLDERLAGQLVVALYRCGRQADALKLYQRMRLRLADELGVDPSPPLRLLYHQILSTAAALDIVEPVDLPTQEVARLPAPRQLPPSPRSFVGRAGELAQLDALLTAAGEQPPAVVVAAVSGTAGVGKTAFALHWAHRVAERFPDGQLYLDLRGFDAGGSVMGPAEAIRGFLDALGTPVQRVPTSLDAQTGLYRSLLSGRRLLVLLDNARDAEQVRPLLPGSAGCLAVVTSRDQLAGLAAAGAHPLTLGLLTAAESRDLLARHVGAERTSAQPQAVDKIITLCARLPLSVAIVAARAAAHPQFPLASIAGELRATRGGIDMFGDGDAAATDVRAVFSWSYRLLGADAARLFRLLGLHPGPDVTVPAAASLAGVPGRLVRSALAELAQAHLVDEQPLGRYGFHDLLRAYATELAHRTDTEPDRRAALLRVLDHYLHTAHAAALALSSIQGLTTLDTVQSGVSVEDITDFDQALAWFAAEHPVLLAVVEAAAGGGFDGHAWRLAAALPTFLDRTEHWHDLASLQEAALAAARRSVSLPGQALAHRELGTIIAQLGRRDEGGVHLARAVELFAQTADRIGEAHTHLNICWLSNGDGQHQKALEHARLALALYQAAGHRTGQANALNAVGRCHAQAGDANQSIAFCRQALTLFQECGDRYGEGGAWGVLGYAHHQLGQYRQAVSCYESALDRARRTGSRHGEAIALADLGETHYATRDVAAARAAWQQALAIFTELGAPGEVGAPNAGEVRAKLDHLGPPATSGPTASIGANENTRDQDTAGADVPQSPTSSVGMSSL